MIANVLRSNNIRKVTTMANTAAKVIHDEKNSEFYMKMAGGGEKAYLSYEYINKNIIDLQHTVVPQSFQGQGIGKILAKAALDFVCEKDLKMKLTCWYLEKYAKDNPLDEYTKRIV